MGGQLRRKRVNKTVFITQRTYIVLGTRYKKYVDRICIAGEEHNIFTELSSVSDMKSLAGTQKMF